MSQSVDKAVVLVIDDDADIVAGLAKVLSAAGYVAHCCRDAEAAMECVRKLTPDLIISDINLGGYSGCNSANESGKNREWPTCH